MSTGKIQMKSGHEIPLLGFGTYRLTGEKCRSAVLNALQTGYRHIDTASAYDNESDVAMAIKDSHIERSKLFITTKVWHSNLHFQDTIDECRRSLDRLNTHYVDLLLIHWPNKSIPISNTLKAMEQLLDSQMIRSAGVSNFTINHLKRAQAINTIPISVNQVEFHPFLNQKELLIYCKEHDIVVTAYSPIARGKVTGHLTIKKLAMDKGVTAAQLTLAWLMQKGIVVIPKASTTEHIKKNFDSQQIRLTPKEMEAMENCNSGERLVQPHWAEFNIDY
ncbi:oxidoreductase of aldo/keto reductase family, subgroup 1 [Chitinispirillum alkaliphilum]|nr:oxidoreductase of aldo/keto reductase family, subgroup 1 [Chitinispirillum alkaliphilum]